MAKRFLKLFAAAGVVTLMAGCAVPTKNVDYAAFKASKPRSIVVLPPLNESPDVGATYGMLSQVTVPLAEAGYYVLPVALVDETFRPLAEEIRRYATTLREVVCCDDGDVPTGMHGYEALLAQAEPATDAVRRGDDLAGIFYTLSLIHI